MTALVVALRFCGELRQLRDSSACVGRDFCISTGGKRRRKLDWEKGNQYKIITFKGSGFYLSKKKKEGKKNL